MQQLNNIQTVNLELKNYANKIKSLSLRLYDFVDVEENKRGRENLLNSNNKERLNTKLLENNNSNNNLLGIFAKEANITNHPKIQAFYQQKEELKEQTKFDYATPDYVSYLRQRDVSTKYVSTKYVEEGKEVKNRKGRVAVNSNSNSIKKPIFLISQKIHRHIKSLFLLIRLRRHRKFNNELAQNNTLVFNFNNNHKKFILFRSRNLNSLLDNSFLNLGNVISKPVLFITPNKITINLFYYVIDSLLSVRRLRRGEKNLSTQKLINENENLEYLCSFLSNKFKKAVELDLIRIHHPSLDSQILANTIGLISKNKKVRFRSIISSLFNNTQILKLNDNTQESNLRYCRPTALVGIKVRLGGRILSQRVIPRFTTVSKQKGAFARNKSDFATISRFTDKSRRGAFSFTVTIAHKSF